MDSTKLPGIAAIFRESLSLPAKNAKLVLSAVILCFVPNSVLLLTTGHISIYPLLLNLLLKIHLITTEDPNTPQFFAAVVALKNEAESFVHLGAISLMIASAISAFTVMMIVQSSLAVSSGQQSTLLDVVVKMKSNWVHVLVTCIYVVLLRTGYTVVCVCFIAVPMLAANGSLVAVATGGAAAVLARLLFVYFAAAWAVAVVVSAAEERCYGLEALWRGGEMVRGRRVQAFFISLMVLLGEGVLAAACGFAGTGNAAGVILASALVVTKMFSHIVYTVFYLHCRKSVCCGRVLPSSGEEMS